MFGRIVKGIDVLHSSIEDVPTDKKDRPCREIKLERAEVLYSPVEDAAEKGTGEDSETKRVEEA